MPPARENDNIAGRAPASWWQRRITVIAVNVALFLLIFFSYTGPSWVEVIQQLILDGFFVLLWVLAAAGEGSQILRWIKLDAQGALRFVTAVATGLGMMSLVILGLGLIGQLNRWTALCLIAAGLACAAIDWRTAQQHRCWRGIIDGLQMRADWGWLWMIVMPIAAVVLAGALLPPGLLWGDEPHGYDVLEYHLQVPREWYEAGQIVPLRHNVFSFFPFNVEMHYLLAMHLRGGPWSGMYLAQLMHVSYVALSVVAIYGVIRQLTGSNRSATLAAVAAAVVPWTAMLAPVAYNEGGLLLYGTLAIGWALISLTQKRSRAACSIAGVMAGFACGTKLTAVPMLLISISVGMLVVGVINRVMHSPSPQPSPEGRGRNVRCALWFVIAGIVFFLPWLVRNVIWTGNPVFPEGTRIFGQAHFDDQQVQRWQQAHSPPVKQKPLSARFSAAYEQLIKNWRWGYLFLPIGILAMALLWRTPQTWFLLALLVLWLIFWLFFTHLQSRFLVLAIPACAMAIGLVQMRVWSVVAALAVVVIALIGLFRPPTKQDAGGLHVRISHWMEVNRRVLEQDNVSLLALQHPAALAPFDTSKVPQDVDLMLIGEAAVFPYERRMSKLRYRTVFDVQTSPGGNIIDDWTAGWPESGVRVVFPSELDRFADYYEIPGLPPEIRRGEPFVLTQ